jgi:hypothetical protein
MTSTASAGGASFGWINRAFIEAGKTGTAFDNYGGEDRFWLGPEGGQFGLYFPPGAPFAFDRWQTPHALQEGEWEVRAKSPSSVTFARKMTVENYGGETFDVAVERTIRLVDRPAVDARLGVAVPAGVRVVAFESENRVTNAGARAWTKEHGLPSVWILAMFSPSADANVVIPFSSGTGPVVNDRYFGKVPADRLAVHEDAGYLVFKCDGQQRGKIGLGPARAKSALGSYSERAHLLTVVELDRPPGATDYVNSMWEKQAEPFGGDVLNSYNDGPTAPGKPSLGGFYEMETSSPALALKPGESAVHVHRTVHLEGERAALAPTAKKVLGVALDELVR